VDEAGIKQPKLKRWSEGKLLYGKIDANGTTPLASRKKNIG